MDFEIVKEWFTLEKIMQLIQEYRSFGPIPGIVLPMLEAFLPFLPLVLFIMANVNAFGLWLGFLFSWSGACLGALLVFWIIRKYGRRRALNFLTKHKQVNKLMHWVEATWIWSIVYSFMLSIYSISDCQYRGRSIQN